jgi:hypothetical protein
MKVVELKEFIKSLNDNAEVEVMKWSGDGFVYGKPTLKYVTTQTQEDVESTLYINAEYASGSSE